MHFRTHNPSKFILTLAAAVIASLLLFWTLTSGSNVASVHAQATDTPTPEATPEEGEESGGWNLPSHQGKLNPPKYPNMDSNLNHIVQQVETGQFTARAAAANAHLHQEEAVAVTIYVVEGYIDTIVEFLKDNGASPRNIGSDYIEAYAPVSLLPEASEQEGVISIRTIVSGQPAQGTVIRESVSVHGVTAWHNAGYKGQGIKIGVIDLGDIGGGGFADFSALMGSELPAMVEARCYTNIGQFSFNRAECETGHEAHGTAVTEAVFDIAPDATFYIANPITSGDLATAVDWMIEHDVDVINHSVGWLWDGPGDGTSPYTDRPLRTVNTAVDGGAVWVNAAGNSATQTWFGNFSDTDGDGFHNFSGEIECNELEVESLFSSIKAQLRWNDSWGGATRDVDLQLYEVLSSGELERVVSLFLIGGEDYQTGGSGHVPFEFLEYFLVPSGTYCLAARSITGAVPNWVQLQILSEQDLLNHTSRGSIGNPAESANAGLLAVGAAHVGDTSTIEGFSSQGPTPDDRIKPDLVGAGGVHSTTYGEAFYGTSQAAPHVSGLAALVKQRFPTYTPQQIANYLKNHASARGTVPNNTWGYGFSRLLASDVATPTPEPSPMPTPSAETCVVPIAGDGAITRSWSSDCTSEGRSGSYARFYTFTLDEPRDVAITLEAEVDTYLYVREGEGTDGHIVHEDNNDDHSVFSLASSTDSGISESLSAGAYTIEATTVTAGETGEFTLTIRGVTGAYDALFDRYDTDGDGQINKPEVIAAVRDYLGGQITKAQVVEVIRHYIIGPPTPAPPVDRAALVALYNATDGPNWTNNHNWLSEVPIGEWYGVSVDDTGRVTDLGLSGNRLSGEIPSELGGLSNLEELYLNDNQLSGEIPSTLGSLSSLIELYLNDNLLSGEIPSELGNLTNLTKLQLWDNELSGEIPAALGSLDNLVVVGLHGNQLSGEIPSELGSLSNLELLSLSYNQLSGEIPAELGSLSNLERLYLNENQLSGEIPSELLALLDLEIMTLWGNQFHGDVLTHASDRNALSSLYNATSGTGWTDNEHWLTNEPVFAWYGVGIDTNGRVTALLLEDNQLTGEMPSELGSLSSLIWLNLSENQLSGAIPPELGNLSNLEWLSLAENELSGCVPSGLINVEFNDLDDLGLPLCSNGN